MFDFAGARADGFGIFTRKQKGIITIAKEITVEPLAMYNGGLISLPLKYYT